jgi:hypothetical protein
MLVLGYCLWAPDTFFRGFARQQYHEWMRSCSVDQRAQIRNSLEQARASRLDSNAPLRLNALRFAFAVLTAGAAYQQVADVFLWLGQLPPERQDYSGTLPSLPNRVNTFGQAYPFQAG